MPDECDLLLTDLLSNCCGKYENNIADVFKQHAAAETQQAKQPSISILLTPLASVHILAKANVHSMTNMGQLFLSQG